MNTFLHVAALSGGIFLCSLASAQTGMSGPHMGSGASDLSTSGSMSSGTSMGGAEQSSAAVPEGASNTNVMPEPSNTAEKKQLVQTFTPKAQYKLSQREAHAAYAEALKACKALSGSERSSCSKEARATLKDDLAYAKQQMQESSAGGSSGSDSGMSGSGAR